MNILIVTTPAQSISGISRVDSQIIKQLQKQHTCTVIYFQPIILPKFLQKSIFLLFHKDIQGFFNNVPFKIPATDLSSYDLVYILNQQNTLSLNWISTKNVIVSVRDVMKIEKTNCISSFFLSLYQRACFRGIKRASLIITDSESEKRYITKTLGSPQKVIVVPLGIDHNEFHEFKKIKKPEGFTSSYNILYVGTEEKRKNFPTILRAIAVLKKTIPHIRLVKVGNSLIQSERTKNLQLIKQLDIEENVFFTGHIQEGIARYYNAADILLMPSLHEGFGFPILEAMACGCPVIASRCDSLPEIGKDSIQYLEDPLDYKTLAEKIYVLLKNKKLQSLFISKGLKRAKDFSWDITGDKINAVCTALLEKKNEQYIQK